MFHVGRDASKVALMALIDLMRESGMTLLDVQWRTEHLASLGTIEVDRADTSRCSPTPWRSPEAAAPFQPAR